MERGCLGETEECALDVGPERGLQERSGARLCTSGETAQGCPQELRARLGR